MGIRERNLMAIKDGFPELYERILSCEVRIKKADFVAIEKLNTLTATPSVVVQTANGQILRLNSAYSPENEANIWLNGQDDIDVENILVFGLGNGAFANAVLKKKKAKNKVLVYEPSAQLFYWSLENCDLVPFFQTPGVRVLVEGLNEEMYSGVMEEMLTLENHESRVFIVTPKMAELFPVSRKVFVEKYLDAVGRLMSNRNTTRRFLHLSPYNQLHNLQHIKENTIVPHLKEVWEKDVPVILIGAGPSLKEEVEVLRKAKDRAFLFAVDSALPYLLKEDIVPDAYICIEADKPMSFFADERTLEIPAFIKVDTTHKLLDIHKGYKIFGYDHGFLEKVYDEYRVAKSVYRYGGNGATSFFAVCKEIGVKNVILLGQDMAYGEDNQSHVGGRNEGYKKDERFIYMNNEGKMVQSRQDWHRFIKWYENAIPVCKFEHVINVSKKGVRIEGTEVMSLQEALEQFGKNHSDVCELISKAEKTFVKGKEMNLLEFYQRCKREVKKIRAIVKDYPHSESRKAWGIYELLSQYEIADKENDFVISQKVGLDKIDEYITKCIEEVERNGFGIDKG